MYGGNVQGSAQQDLFADEVYDFKFSNLISNSGNLNYLYPLPDKSGRFLLSWDLCRVVVDGEVSACSQLSDEEQKAKQIERARKYGDAEVDDIVLVTMPLVKIRETFNKYTTY